MISENARLSCRFFYALAFISPATGLLLMGYLDQDHWVACILVMTVCKCGAKKSAF